MTRQPVPDILQGTLDLLILRTLQTGTMHGWAISERIQQISQDVLQVNQGSLYPALHRLEHQGLDRCRVGRLRAGPPGEILPAHRGGRRQLAIEAGEWERMTMAIARVMKMA